MIKLKETDIVVKSFRNNNYELCKSCGSSFYTLVKGTDKYGDYLAIICNECGSRIQTYKTNDIQSIWNKANRQETSKELFFKDFYS